MPDNLKSSPSKRRRWAGYIVTAIPVLFLIFDLSIKLAYIQPVTDAFTRLGDPILSHILFPTYIGALLWLGLYLRDARLRTLFS